MSAIANLQQRVIALEAQVRKQGEDNKATVQALHKMELNLVDAFKKVRTRLREALLRVQQLEKLGDGSVEKGGGEEEGEGEDYYVLVRLGDGKGEEEGVAVA